MNKKLILTLASLLASTSAQGLQLSDPLGYEWFSSRTNFTNVWSQPFKITENFVSGFSSGAVTTANILRRAPDGIDSFGILSGVLYYQDLVQSNGQFKTIEDLDQPIQANLTGKQVFTYIGTHDAYNASYFDKCVDFFKASGANVSVQVIDGYNHTVPSDLPPTEGWHPKRSCGLIDFNPPHVSPLDNCGYDMAHQMLSALDSNTTLKPRSLNHSKYGDLHAFNQTPFALPKSYLGEIGYIYIPHACKNGQYCKALMFLHGCGQGQPLFRETDLRRTGLLEYAATNNYIVVYPMNNYPGDNDTLGQYPYCWPAMKTKDAQHPQIISLKYILSHLVFGGAEQPSNLTPTQIIKKAEAVKMTNQREMDIKSKENILQSVEVFDKKHSKNGFLYGVRRIIFEWMQVRDEILDWIVHLIFPHHHKFKAK